MHGEASESRATSTEEVREEMADETAPSLKKSLRRRRNTGKTSQQKSSDESAITAAATPAIRPDDFDLEEQLAADWRPKRLFRTVLSSMANSTAFGSQMHREAKQRRFFEAQAQAFLGDGLKCNWTIQQKQFPKFTAILDFIHPLSYLFSAAKTLHSDSNSNAWDQYATWMTACWRGQINN